MAGIDAGEWVGCPSCGTTVLGKAMIPVLGEEGSGVRYLCVACARALIVKPGGTPSVSGNGPDGLVAGVGPALASGTGPDTD